ncbi:6113_t:CDS:2 [Funneliformis geosporum]|uniref:6113_t:CDS:1 n=1 Tax=Funneliformis geosporum TaxID=1117311 RepID=A0A9W4WUN8_9GLOM|nr:6113_t:CDS:2 [Funneliformis geosporum]
MYHQRSISSMLNQFLIRINFNNIFIPPHNNNARFLAVQIRNGSRIQILTAVDLLTQNIKYEANRLHVFGRYIINLATIRIWHHRLSTYQRHQIADVINPTLSYTHKPVDDHNLVESKIAYADPTKKEYILRFDDL